ncbi:MAG: hypothetical protein LBE76_00145 [Nitrososphaerota archaeon]|nr:hypothetical protein [Nitrososphaerota archaeon]
MEVLDHDFPIKELGKATSYGVYDVMGSAGFVSVGLSDDAVEFAVSSMCKWWFAVGREAYSGVGSVFVTCDCGGGCSDGVRVRLWKIKLQELLNEFGLVFRVSHFFVGSFKWDEVGYWLFLFVGKDWCGWLLVSLVVIVSLVGVVVVGF